MKFRIRTLLVFLFIASIPLDWLAFIVREAGIQKETVRQIREVGGDAQYWQPTRKDSPYQALNRRLAGPDAIDRVRAVIITNGAATDTLIERTSRLEGVVMLVIQQCQLTDRGFRHISNLRGLELLDATRTTVTDAGLPYLVGLKELKSLSLQGTQVSDNGILVLSALKNSELINVAYCDGVTLSGARKLEQVLGGTQVIHERNVSKSDARDVEVSGAPQGLLPE